MLTGVSVRSESKWWYVGRGAVCRKASWVTAPIVDTAVQINARVTTVWPLITDPRPTTDAFGCAIDSSWRVGTPVVERDVVTGRIVARGTLLKVIPEQILEFTIAANEDAAPP